MPVKVELKGLYIQAPIVKTSDIEAVIDSISERKKFQGKQSTEATSSMSKSITSEQEALH